MFKKLKDKFAEEVKSSPQRFQQMAQAAQAVVTSASSSISDMTNNDLFTIGGDETPTGSPAKSPTVSGATSNQINSFHDVSLSQSPSPQTLQRPDRESTPHIAFENVENSSNHSRKLSTSSMASDVSFRLPSYDSPQTMYHLQSDVDISASEAEDRGFSPGPMNLERVSKDQLYQAYRRTQERYTKYRTRYADLARHYRLLERENSKARAVLVETQDKALRRISELREQCVLEQSAKAHLEHALRLEIDERNLKIDTLSTKINLLQSKNDTQDSNDKLLENDSNKVGESLVLKNNDATNLIDFNSESDSSQLEENATPALQALNSKIEKLEQLVIKYKDSLKILKDKNSNLEIDLKKKSVELDKSTKEVVRLQAETEQLEDTRKQIMELKESNKILENKLHDYQTNRDQQNNALMSDLDAATSKVQKLENEIDHLKKREEENAISLAENKLEIHRELESKEAEIKFLKERIENYVKEIDSHQATRNEYDEKVKELEKERNELSEKMSDTEDKQKLILELEKKIEELKKIITMKDQNNSKQLEQYKCLELEYKTEKAEKLAMIDRNKYLESRMQSNQEETSKRNKLIASLEQEISGLTKKIEIFEKEGETSIDNDRQIEEWKRKYSKLEMEVKEEREEFIKLRDEIEKMIKGSESMEKENENLRQRLTEVDSNLKDLKELKLKNENFIKDQSLQCHRTLKELRNELLQASECINQMEDFFKKEISQTFDHVVQTTVLTNKCQTLSGSPDLENEMKKMESQIQIILKEKLDICNKFEESWQALEKAQHENHQLRTRFEEKQKQIESCETEINTLREQLVSLNNFKIDLETKVNTLEDEKRAMQIKADNIINDVENLQSELKEIKCDHMKLSEEKNLLEQRISLMEEMETRQVKEVQVLKNENQLKTDALNNEIKRLNSELINLTDEKNPLAESLKDLTSQLEMKQKELNDKLTENQEIQEKLRKITRECGMAKDKCELLKQEKEELHEKCLSFDIKLGEAKKFIEENEILNSKLNELESSLANDKANVEMIKILNNSKEKLEKDLIEIIKEKDSISQTLQETLNEINTAKSKVEKENLERIKTQQEQDGLISNLRDNLNAIEKKYEIIVKDLADKQKELEDALLLKFENDKLTHQLFEQRNDKTEAKVKYEALESVYNTLQTENNKLKKEIEDLQKHIATISNENSNLNDRVRELLAKEEISKSEMQNINTQPNEYELVKETLSKNKDHIAELERQNTILVEEKLELEDQLRYLTRDNGNNNITTVTDVELELTRVREKNRELTEDKMLLESRLADLELMSRSGADNMRQLELNSEKLRFSKEKLEQRLDEALVSLRHARALEESTELEYLRNILYEYLTGPSSHSFTLAKVLAAVVKFDEKQTELVLQKEKDRQGLLGQILQP